MKTTKFFYALLLVLFVVNLILLYQFNKTSNTINYVSTYNTHLEEMFDSYISNNKHAIQLDDSICAKKFCLRINGNMCSSCIYKAEALMESVFGKNGFDIVSDKCCTGMFSHVSEVGYDSISSPLDNIDNSNPYFFINNDNNMITFTLLLDPENSDFNYKILKRIKEELSD